MGQGRAGGQEYKILKLLNDGLFHLVLQRQWWPTSRVVTTSGQSHRSLLTRTWDKKENILDWHEGTLPQSRRPAQNVEVDRMRDRVEHGRQKVVELLP